MMDVIFDSMSIARRVGAQVGAQIEVDRVINEWYRYSEKLKLERDQAQRLAEAYSNSLKSCRKELEIVKMDLDNWKKEIASLSGKLKSRTAELGMEKKRISRLNAAKLARKLHVDQVLQVIQKQNTDLSQEVGKQRQLKEKDLAHLTARITDERRYLLATRARLVGVEKIYGALVSEIFERGEIAKYKALQDTMRRKILLSAWNDIVSAAAPYLPSLRFSYESLPFD